MISDGRQPAYVRMHRGSFYVYLPDEADRSGELVSDNDDLVDDEDSCDYVLKVARDPVEVARLIAPHYRLAGPNDGGFYFGESVPEELLQLVRMLLDLWPLPPLIQRCFREPLSSDGGPLS